MRMWMIPPSLLCRQHLLGEHYELHKLVGHLSRNRSITKYLEDRILEPLSIQSRHHDLVNELLIRYPKQGGHASPLKQINLTHLSCKQIQTTVNISKSYNDIISRCLNCYTLILNQ